MNPDKLKQLSAALAQILTSALGVASLFGYTLPQDKLAAFNASATQILGALLVVAALLPSLFKSVKSSFAVAEDPPQSKQAGKSRLSFAMLMSVLALAACASVVAPKSVDQSLAYVEAGSTVARQALTSLLLQRQVSKEKAAAFGESMDRVDAAVDIGRSLKASGDLSGAKTQLELAQKLLTQLQAELTAAAKASGELK